MSQSFVTTLRAVLARKPRKDSPIKYGGRYGHALYHVILSVFGLWPAYLTLSFVIPWFALVRSSARKADYFYLERRFPGQNRLQRFFRSTRHITNFALVLIDQAATGILGRERVTIDFPAREKLLEMGSRKRGLVIVTAHVGNFIGSTIAVHHLDAPTNVIIDTKYYQGNHFFELGTEEVPFKIIPPSFKGMVQATNALRAGEIVFIMGDRKDNTRTVELDFLGKKAQFPLTSYHLAMATGSDIAILLTARTGKLTIRLELDVIHEGGEWEASEKEETLGKMAEIYAKTLEKYVERYPYMWYNFFNFWGNG